MAKRNRIMYASQSVRVNGHLLYRVQTLGSNSTFTSENIFELGHLDVIDVVDDVPAVAVTIDTNDFGGVETFAVMAGMNPARMTGSGTVSTAYLRTNTDCTGSGSARYYHGVALADFGLTDGVALWAPVQAEASMGTLDDTLDMTLFMDKVFVNNIAMTYGVGANAALNFAAETDNKMWLLNNGKFVSQEAWELVASGVVNSKALKLSIVAGTNSVPELSNCKRAFLAYTTDHHEGVIVQLDSERSGTIYPIETDDGASAGLAGKFVYKPSTNQVFMPSNAATLWTTGIKITIRYASAAYAATGANTTPASYPSTSIWGKYFELISSTSAPDEPKNHYPEQVAALRQGQAEIYLLDPDLLSGKTNSDWDMQLRIQTVDITAAPGRTAANEIGHLRPYTRTMNFPVEITTRVTTLASDLEHFATFAGKDWATISAGTGADLSITHLMSKENLCLVVKVFQQTDEEAGGNGQDRRAMLTELEGQEYYDWTGAGTYTGTGSCTTSPRERPLKTIIVPNLKITAENYQNAVGGGGGGGTNATQGFDFRSTNEMYIVKGDVDIQDAVCIERNTSATQY